MDAMAKKVDDATSVAAFGVRVKAAREKMGFTQDVVAKHVGLQRTTVTQWEHGRSKPPMATVEKVAQLLGTTAQNLAFGITDEPKVVAPDPDSLGYVLAPEVVYGKAPTSTTSIGTWGLPTNWLRTELGVTDTTKVVIYKVEVTFRDSAYELGDRLIVDTASNRPSPPGAFLFWDGVGPQIGDIMVMPGGGKKLMAKVTTVHGGTFETETDKLVILGRIRGKAMKV